MLTVMVDLLVLALVWITVVAGLLLIVRDRVEEEDLIEFLSKHEASHWETACTAEEGTLTSRLYNSRWRGLDRNPRLNRGDARPESSR
jgi:hypothetical protein